MNWLRLLNKIVVITIIIVPVSLFAQITFQRTYGGTGEDEAFWVQQLSDNGYIVGGRTASMGAGQKDLWIFRLDEHGNMLWQKTYGGAQDEGNCCVRKTSDDGFIIVSDTKSFGAGGGDIWLLKTNASGDTLWSRLYGGSGTEGAGGIYQTPDNGYIFNGTTESFGAGSQDYMVIKIDALGYTQWVKTFGGPDSDYARGFCPTPDGGYLFIGSTKSYGAGNKDIWAIKTNTNGDTQWTRTYGGINADEGFGVAPTRDGGYAIGGMTSSYGLGSYDLYVIKITSTGAVQWTKTYGTPYYELGCFGDTTTDGGYIISGTVGYTGTACDLWLLKLNSSGDTMWTKTFGGTSIDFGWWCKRASDNGYIIVGKTWSYGAGNGDAWVIKTDQSGNVGVEENIPSNNYLNNHLTQNFPNPFKSQTAIRYELPANSDITLTIYDINGCLVKYLVNKHQSTGVYSIIWDGKNNNGDLVNNGIYVCRLKTNSGAHEIRKLILTR